MKKRPEMAAMNWTGSPYKSYQAEPEHLDLD